MTDRRAVQREVCRTPTPTGSPTFGGYGCPAPLGIEMVQGEIEPALTAVHGLAEALGGGVPAWLADAEDEDVEDFFDAVLAFYDAAP